MKKAAPPTAAKRKRATPPTLLDWLEAETYVGTNLAARIRKISPAIMTSTDLAAVFGDRETMFTLLQLIVQLELPKRLSARRPAARAFLLSAEQAYYKSLGQNDATAKTAKKRNVTTRTVSAAAKRFPVTMPTNTRRPELRDLFNFFHKAGKRGKVGSKLH